MAQANPVDLDRDLHAHTDRELEPLAPLDLRFYGGELGKSLLDEIDRVIIEEFDPISPWSALDWMGITPDPESIEAGVDEDPGPSPLKADPLLRLCRRYSANELAEMTGLTKRHIERVRGGHPISSTVADRIARALGVHPVNIWGAAW